MKTFFGGMFMNKENLRKEGILYPIKLEYYKIKDLKSSSQSWNSCQLKEDTIE